MTVWTLGEQISVTVNGKRRNKGIGLEIPAIYTFLHKKASKILKLRELLKGKEEKADKQWSKEV